MEYIIKINLDNDAFEDDYRPELAYLLHRMARGLQRQEPGESFAIRDSNGNTVGTAEVKAEEAQPQRRFRAIVRDLSYRLVEVDAEDEDDAREIVANLDPDDFHLMDGGEWALNDLDEITEEAVR